RQGEQRPAHPGACAGPQIVQSVVRGYLRVDACLGHRRAQSAQCPISVVCATYPDDCGIIKEFSRGMPPKNLACGKTRIETCRTRHGKNPAAGFWVPGPRRQTTPRPVDHNYPKYRTLVKKV